MVTQAQLMNWSGNYSYQAPTVAYPTSIEELQSLVREAKKVRALGSRHSFNAIADSDEVLISLEKLPRQVEIDAEKGTVTFTGNMTYAELCLQLDAHGLALHNLASLPHISVAGAIQTGTHGSGFDNGNLATGVVGVEFVTPSGALLQVSEESHGTDFKAMVVALGALGVISKLTMQAVPAFDVAQQVYVELSLPEVLADFEIIMKSAYSVSLFTHWQDDKIKQVWQKHIVTADLPAPQAAYYGGVPSDGEAHPILGVDPSACTSQMGVMGRWHERLPHFRADHTPSHGEELQSEYFVPFEQATEAMQRLNTFGAQLAPYLLVSEIRTIAADDLWLSPAYQQQSVAFHFTWKRDWPHVQQVLPRIEAELVPLGARPHWGKLYTMPSEQVQARYSRLNEFKALCDTLDPTQKFVNPFVRDALGIQ